MISTRALDNPFAILVDTVTGEVLEIYFYTDVTNSVSASYEDKTIRGRSEPIKHYTFTGSDTVTLNNVVLVASMWAEDGGIHEDAHNQWTFLKALMFPDYSAGEYIGPPHKVRLKLGDFYDEECVIEEFQSTAKPPFNRFHLPQRIEVSFVFKRVDTPKGYDDVRVIL